MSKSQRIDFGELRKLNIGNLFETNDGSKPYLNGNLDINTLFTKNTTDLKDFSFDSQNLLDGIKKRRKKTDDYYMETYRTCCATISSANDSGLVDILFDVPDYVPECIDYKPKKCLNFIREKLEEQKISSLILSESRIFITWSNLEEKLLASEKEINENNNKYTDQYHY